MIFSFNDIKWNFFNQKMLILVIALLLLNIVTFYIYGKDKKKAKQNKIRISEKKLIMMSLFGGGMGGYIAMRVFRHKTKKEHWYFTFFNLLGIVLQVVLIVLFATFI